ncbi:succinylglutamate desuccinylase/aspartoacylase family protein [Primorskyibacter flagellatus]|uniref:succinylglutamate desuccinylase/aspartoacylase family protein n=1 Tax=Primorskyibacter flagellatus TaxID=1387277 RepID=UPI003A913A9D
MAVPTISRISCPIDFDKDGRQAGYARAPLSRNTAGWGVIEIPIISIKNGTGPTILLTGGVHGDEYEGQIAISRLAQTLDPGEVQGRVIMLPCVNVPAALADTRLSPIDGFDINRCFPGDPRGTFSPMLAHFLDSVVLPYADVSIDMHTAGHSCDSALSTNMHHSKDAEMLRKTLRAAEAFGAPYNVVFAGVDEGATFTSCVEARGLVSLGTELGGWGRVSIDGVRVGSCGIRNILKHFNVLEGTPNVTHKDGTPVTRHMMVRGTDAYLTAPRNGIFEPTHYHGATVFAGQIAGYLHFPEDIDTPAQVLHYPSSGVIWMGAGPGRVTRGDPVAVLMEDFRDDWP